MIYIPAPKGYDNYGVNYITDNGDRYGLGDICAKDVDEAEHMLEAVKKTAYITGRTEMVIPLGGVGIYSTINIFLHKQMWAVLKRGYHGTHHHMSGKHLHRYVNEFSYRLSNNANCERDTIDRMESLVKSSVGKKLSYRELTQ